MRNYFPMKTFQQDAVVRRLNVLYKLLKDIDVEYSEDETPVATFTLDGNVVIEEDLNVGGDLEVTGDLVIGGAIEYESLTLTGDLNADGVYANEIIENMEGYSFVPISEITYDDLNIIYAGVCKNGNKITFVMFMTFTYKGYAFRDVGTFIVPSDVYAKLYPYILQNVDTLDTRTLDLVKERQSIPSSAYGEIFKAGNNQVVFSFAVPSGLTVDATYSVRYEATFLLSDNLAPQE